MEAIRQHYIPRAKCKTATGRGLARMGDDTPWEARSYFAAHEFARRCAELRDSNPYDQVALDHIIVTLATELWDRGFSQTEIKRSFEGAFSALVHTARERNDGVIAESRWQAERDSDRA